MAGYQYLREAVIQTVKNSKVFTSVTKNLYPAVAEKYNIPHLKKLNGRSEMP